MKHLMASVALIAPALLCLPIAHASNAQPATTKNASAQSKPSKPKPAAAKGSNAGKSTTAARKPQTSQRSTTARRAAVGTAAAAATGAAVLAPRALNADELALADRVHTGRIACELGQHVNVAKDDKHPGHFLVSGNGFNFHMSPVGTSTGVVRLEDSKAGAVWLQIANKSMLMNQKQGKRLADECMSPEQLQVAEAIKKNPPQSLLESPGK